MSGQDEILSYGWAVVTRAVRVGQRHFGANQAQSTMNPHLQRAHVLYQRSRYDEAERELGMALAKDPEEPWAFALLGACRAAQKDFAKADELGRQAMTLAPDSAAIRHVVARIQLDRNDLAAAEQTVTEAIELDP